MKIAASTYSFGRYLTGGKLTQFDCIASAKEMGFDAIEFVDIIPHDGSSKEEYAKKLREECERLDMPISNFTFGAELLNPPDSNPEQELKRVLSMIDLAAILGAKSVRHDATGGFAPGGKEYRGFDDVLPQIADSCRQITRYAASKGIKTMVENHGRFCQDSRRVEKLVNAVGDENFGLLCDMGNFLCADENPAVAYGRVAPYAFYAHAKDFHQKDGNGFDPGEGFFQSRNGNYLRGSIIGHGVVPIRHCLSALKNAGYDGFIGIEFEGMEDNLQGLRIGLANLRRMVEDVYGK